jgi:hypothetical protein
MNTLSKENITETQDVKEVTLDGSIFEHAMIFGGQTSYMIG